jgi:predicted metal-dependent hydrolase
MSIPFDLRYSKTSRRVRIAVHADGSVTVSAPKGLSAERITPMVESKRLWIERAIEKCRKRSAGAVLHKENIDRIEFSRKVGNLIDAKAKIIGVYPRKIGVRKMRSRWGSCSKEGNISINLLLGHLPPDLLEYVVIHELCHMVHHDHSRNFWALVGKYVPEFKSHKKQLRRYGYLLHA